VWFVGHSVPVPPPTPQPSAAASNIPEQEEDEFIRLQQDLSVVMEKVRLCREILMVSDGIETDEALADIIGFLEACRDRMVDVIEAGTQGLLGEELFEVCLKVHDSISKTLEAEKVFISCFELLCCCFYLCSGSTVVLFFSVVADFTNICWTIFRMAFSLRSMTRKQNRSRMAKTITAIYWS
jgi:hypothetical protein